MSDKTSQRTEEEMLDQTFVGYDEEMTVQTEDGAKYASSATPTDEPAKKKNQNLLVYGAMGVAALGFLGFKFLGGSAPEQQVQQEPIQATQQPVQVAPQTTAPVIAATTEAVQVPVQVAVPTPVETPTVPEPTPAVATPVIDPVAQYTGNTTTASLPRIEPVQAIPQPVQVAPLPTAPVIAAVKPVNVDRVAAVPAITASNAEAMSNNEQLLAQFQELLDSKYDPKFNKIEKSLDEQKEFNKSMEERLARLEAGKSTRVVQSSSDSSETTKAEPKVVKKIVRKPIVIKRKVERKVVKNTKNEESDVLIDRTSVRKTEIQKIEPMYPKLEIHSVYSGRIWTKNSDGTLSTFAVGDKLPSGEVIKKIDEDKERVTTDKRVISQ